MFAERPTVQWLTGERLHLQHGPIDVVLKAWAAEDRHPSPLARPPRNDCGQRLRSPLPWGEGQGEGMGTIDRLHPLTPTLSPWERERSVVSPRYCFNPSTELGGDFIADEGDCFDPICDLARAYAAAAARFQ